MEHEDNEKVYSTSKIIEIDIDISIIDYVCCLNY